MGKLIVIRLGDGNFEQGFPVTLMIREDSKEGEEVLEARLPPNLDINNYYNCWRDSCFPVPTQKHKKLSQQLSTSLNTWLNSEQFLPKWTKLVRDVTPNDVIRLVLQAENIEIQRLPWHRWHFFEDYPKAEISLSPLNYGTVSTQGYRSQIRILAILGNDKDIDLKPDEEYLKELPAEIVWLRQRDRLVITEHLWDNQGWDILFFAGHSKTQEGEGLLKINQSDYLTIYDLDYALKKAIRNGLKLAIFNSCQGLGLALQLSYLRIPQVIVMREKVPDTVAQEFLKYFLQTFSRSESPLPLHLTVREAREQLQGLESQFPCASWLPVLYSQNFAVTGSLTWQDLQLRGTSENNSSDRYIERPPVEKTCFQAIEQPGGLIRIKAPQKMGKAMLMGKIFEYAEQKNYRTVRLNFREPTREVISNYDEFLRWFCKSISQELKLLSIEADQYWENAEGDKNTKCRRYFSEHILPKIDTDKALVLGIYSVDRIFPYNFAPDFFSMLRSWHDAAKTQPRVWAKLRLILVYSTEVYVKMDVEKSPFENVGETIILDEFTPEQIDSLANKYKVNLNDKQIKKLMLQVGGHPYLVDRIMNYLKTHTNNEDKSIEQTISLQSLENICESYLNQVLEQLNDSSEISKVMRQIMKNLVVGKVSKIDDKKILFLLESMGVIKEKKGQIKLRNNLYRKYFKKKLSE